MNLKSSIAAAVLALASASSSAGVIYEWISVSNPMPLPTPSIRISFDNGAVQNGTFSLRGPLGETLPGFNWLSYSLNLTRFFPHGIRATDKLLSASINVNFTDDNFYLTGSFGAVTESMDFRISSGTFGSPDQRLWRIDRMNDDGLFECGGWQGGFCSGATGYFRQVPEPTSVALLGLGLAGALAARRRKRKA